MPVEIRRENPLSADLALLMARHVEAMHADTPPGSIHMMDAGALAAPDICFFVMREGETPVGMGAFRRIDDTHAEIKSMHILREVRGRGLANRMLDHLLAEAAGAGFQRVSLETGSQPSFVAARRLYEAAGFDPCGPFDTYAEDPNSVFMTRGI